MKVLFLCKKFPYPLKDGESIAVSNLCRDLRDLGCDISLLSLNTSKHYTDPQALPASYNYFTSIHTVDVDNTVKPWKAMVSLFTGESYHIRRFRSSAFKAKLIELLSREKFDIIQLETLYLAPYISTIRQHSNAKIVMRAHNVEHEIWERITHNSGSKLRKMYLAYLTRKLKAYEIEQLPAYDYLVTLTDRDLEFFREKGYVNGAAAAPIGLNPALYTTHHPSFGPRLSLGFIGSLDWTPNLEGLQWFLHHCWPLIHRRWPDITFHIAGRNTPMHLIDMKLAGVTVHGEVENAGEFIHQQDMMVVPLFSGSGMRVKIIESMLMGKVVVTTSVGKEGIEGKHGEHFLIANDAASFVDAIADCIATSDKAQAIGQQARKLILQHYDSRQVALRMMEIYREVLHHDESPALHQTPIV